MPRRRIALGHLIARGPVLRGQAAAAFDEELPSGVQTTGEARVPFPVLPLQVFGVTYDLDAVVVDDHPAWDMHELARVRTPDGPVWLCKDSRAEDLAQSIVTSHADALTVLPEVTLRRRRDPVEVDDTDAPRHLALAYTNDAGERVEVSLRGGPLAAQRCRNSSTMGHSSKAALAVLDVSHRAFARADVRIGGVAQRVRRILGLVPFSVLLRQTQGGFAAGRWEQSPEGTTHGSVRQAWHTEPTAIGLDGVTIHPWRTLRFRFRRAGEQLELVGARVEAWDEGAAACEVRFLPALPDLRYPFEGVFRGRFRIDVNGQIGHGTGDVEVRSQGHSAELKLRPTAPFWLADRTMTVVLDVPVGGPVRATASIHATGA